MKKSLDLKRNKWLCAFVMVLGILKRDWKVALVFCIFCILFEWASAKQKQYE